MKPSAQLLDDRKRLTSYFRTRSTAEGLRSDPRRNARQLDLLGRLYEEYRNERGIIIDLDVGSAMAIDLLIKNVDFEDIHVELACVAVNDVEGRLDELWDIYKAWIHSRANPASIESIVARHTG